MKTKKRIFAEAFIGVFIGILIIFLIEFFIPVSNNITYWNGFNITWNETDFNNTIIANNTENIFEVCIDICENANYTNCNVVCEFLYGG